MGAVSPPLPLGGQLDMAADYVVLVEKLKGQGIILRAAKHNKRAIQRELGADGHIDPVRSALNCSLAGASTPMEIAAEAQALVKAAGIMKLRSDHVAGIEVIISLPANHRADQKLFFEDSLEWTRSFFNCPVLSFDVHLDESTPHAHALLLPLVDGHMVGSDLKGYKSRLRAINLSFHAEVGIKHALRKPTPKLSGQTKVLTGQLLLSQLKSDPVMQSVLWPIIRNMIRDDPSPIARLLGVEVVKARPNRSSVDIMTSKGKGPKHIGFDDKMKCEPYLV